ncbi:glycosyltransferase [Vibrio sp. OPT24]|uniref:glycosyltransferase n=1 Tax=Vibrio sp. OPT24 TaxID=2778643 RepID=UPI002AD35ADB|nr:glycosyltransferase [Vibrio sp. OPT24]
MNKLLCFVDKTIEPQHSFIDGMLAKRMSDEFDVTIYTSWDRLSDIKKMNYHNAKLRPYLFPRKGFLRILNIFVVSFICLFHSLTNLRSKTVSFCRNEPTFLLGSFLVTLLPNFSYVFQSSFPHEDVGEGIKAKIAKSIFKICGPHVKKITAVSDEGLIRMEKYFPNAYGVVIPLMGDDVIDEPLRLVNDKHLKFIYIGTLAESRDFEVVVDSFVKAKIETNGSFILDIYGGSTYEWNNIIKKSKYYSKIKDCNVVNYRGSLVREEVLKTICDYDIGISQVPENKVTSEMSPTKLSEYMSCGLAVLASDTVPSQSELINNSKGGVLTGFNEEEIKNGIEWFVNNKCDIYGLKKNSISYIKDNFTYDNVKEDLLLLLRNGL